MTEPNFKGLMPKYFVLNPNKNDVYGKASRVAISTYAKAILPDNEALAMDLWEWLRNIREGIAEAEKKDANAENKRVFGVGLEKEAGE